MSLSQMLDLNACIYHVMSTGLLCKKKCAWPGAVWPHVFGPADSRDQRDQRVQREETWNTVPMTKNSRTIDPTKIPKISKVRHAVSNTHLFPYCRRLLSAWISGSRGGLWSLLLSFCELWTEQVLKVTQEDTTCVFESGKLSHHGSMSCFYGS